ncbi:MAG TPA: hypothetical protein PKC18_18585, partial [Lacipirellulaceae bacterium]|nr:hypothetical protein [Lacipirellulaceae bacterium]
ADATDGDASAAGTTATDAAADTAELAETEIAAAGPEIPDPQPREAAKPVVEQYSASVPRVMLSAAHRALCRVGVGDALPTIELPQASGGSASIDSLAGSKATVVLFWTSDPWMSRTALADVQRDVVDRLAGDAVRAVGVAVGDVGDAPVEVRFPQLIDADGSAFAQVGEQALPRIYVLDGQRRIAWFDIEYSESSRRELRATLAALAADGAN